MRSAPSEPYFPSAQPAPSEPSALSDNHPSPQNGHRGQTPDPIAPDDAPTNRLHVVLLHTQRYMFAGQARLAADAGVARSTISRLMAGRSNPSIRVARAVQAALERELGRPLPLAELFSPDGTYPTPSGCRLCGCTGCMPEEAYDRHGSLRPAFRSMRPGDWSMTRRPRPTIRSRPQESPE